MNVAITVGHTSSGKEHFEVLDGLRGSAAFLIVLFHIFNYPFGFRPPLHLMHHAYLAVDFFFGLSGFVVAYAYDDRWTRMTMLQFFRIRLIQRKMGTPAAAFLRMRPGPFPRQEMLQRAQQERSKFPLPAVGYAQIISRQQAREELLGQVLRLVRRADLAAKVDVDRIPVEPAEGGERLVGF